MSIERFSPIALAVLALLYESPMHPYRMQQLIKERGKNEVINVRQRASLYQTIDRLLRAELITIQETTREEKRPERTIYAITEHGRSTLRTWMHELLSTPVQEFPVFPAILAYLPLMTPEDALAHLDQRAHTLETEVGRLDAQRRSYAGTTPRVFLIEIEYLHTMLHTELRWVRSIVDDLRGGSLTWT